MMHGDSRVMVVVCLETASLPAPCLSTSTSPRSREEPYFCAGNKRLMWQERSVRWFTGACEKSKGREIGDEGRDRG